MYDLLEILGKFPGVTVGASEENIGRWIVTLDIAQTPEGWRSLEFFAWITTDLRRSGFSISLEAASPPPYLNRPGQCLYFEFCGDSMGETAPSEIASLIEEWKADYVPVGEEVEPEEDDDED